MTSDTLSDKADMAYDWAELIDPLVTQHSWPRQELITWGRNWGAASGYSSHWHPFQRILRRGERGHLLDRFVMQVALSMSCSCLAVTADAARSLLYHTLSLGSTPPAWISVTEMIAALCSLLQLRIRYCQEKSALYFISIPIFLLTSIASTPFTV